MRAVRRAITLLAIVCVAVAAMIFFPDRVFGLLEYMGKKKVLAELNAAGSTCREIHLDRWGDNESNFPIDHTPLDRTLFLSWLAALPPDGNVPSTMTKCWIPHHSVRFTMAGGGEQKMEICFTCNEFVTDVSGRRKIPLDWREPFRELFRMHDITDKTPTSEEISRHWEKLDQEP